MTKILELQLQHQSFQWTFRVDFPEDWLVWSPCCPRDFKESSPTPQCKGINSLVFCLLYGPAHTTVCDHLEGHTLTIWTYVSRVMSLLFNTLSRFVIAFLPRSNHLLISWLQSLSAGVSLHGVFSRCFKIFRNNLFYVYYLTYFCLFDAIPW